MSDGIGRRPTIIFGALLMCAATAIQTVSLLSVSHLKTPYTTIPCRRRIVYKCLLVLGNDFSVYLTFLLLTATFRFLIGFGLTFAANSAPMLVSEVAYPPHRAAATSMYNSLWYLGSIMYVIPNLTQRYSIYENIAPERHGLRSGASRYHLRGLGVFPLFSRACHPFFKSAWFGLPQNHRDGSLQKVERHKRSRHLHITMQMGTSEHDGQ